MLPLRQVDWKVVVEQIRARDPAGEETLYRTLVSGARLFLMRRLGTADVEDRVHDLFVIVMEAVRSGELREPERLMGFVRTVLYRQLNFEILRRMRARETSIDLGAAGMLAESRPNPEQEAITEEKLALMRRVLSDMSERDFEVLTRCYLLEEPPERVRREMSLSSTQLHVIKSRAKARLNQLMQQRLGLRLLNPR